MRLLFYGDEAEQKKKIVGPLYGQLTFENVPETKKIIVISKIPEAYEIVEQLILDLDRQEMAEIPKVVVLKYADPEDLSERLNAMFNEPGTIAPIRRTPSRSGQLLDGADHAAVAASPAAVNPGAATTPTTPPAIRVSIRRGGPGGWGRSQRPEPAAAEQRDRTRAVHPRSAQQVDPGAGAAGVPQRTSSRRFAVWMSRVCR